MKAEQLGLYRIVIDKPELGPQLDLGERVIACMIVGMRRFCPLTDLP
jgi:hypothetical protein